MLLSNRRFNSQVQGDQLRSAAWAFIFYRAAQDPRMQAIQVKFLLESIEYILDDDLLTSQVVTSEYGKALLFAEYLEQYKKEKKFNSWPLSKIIYGEQLQPQMDAIFKISNHFSNWSIQEEYLYLKTIEKFFTSSLSKKLLADKNLFLSGERNAQKYYFNSQEIRVKDELRVQIDDIKKTIVNKFCVILDPGHGGITINGNYITPGKRFEHNEGNFHKNKMIYEGVCNRAIAYRVAKILKGLQINHVIVGPITSDISLPDRVELANSHTAKYTCIYISSHTNASPLRNQRGFEIYTSKGQDQSDKLASLYWENVNTLLQDQINFRSDFSDGDPDKEAGFYILVNTSMPSILIEHLFYDNYEDALLLMDENILNLFAEAQVKTILDYMKTLE